MPKPSQYAIDGMSRSSAGFRMSRMEIADRIVAENYHGGERNKKNVNDYKKELNIDDHMISLREIEKRYDTDLQKGLTMSKAAEFLKLHGPNRLPPPKKKSLWRIFFVCIFGNFSIILWIACALSFIGFALLYTEDPETSPFENLYLGSVILFIILATGMFGFYQEWANISVMEGFSKFIPKTATVIRSNAISVVFADTLVIGDIIMLVAGDCIPADIRIMQASSFKVDNSSITGESEPVNRSAQFTDINPLETKNLAFFGTNVIEGSATGIVIACGVDTLMGHIAALTSELHSDETPIKRELKSFTRIITGIAIAMGAVFFCLSLIAGESLFNSFTYLIAIIVANVPEGLLVTMTACLTLTAKKMVRKNCLCKNLHAIETLGSTTVICSDKTGTLTQNKMTVSHLYYDSMIFDVSSGEHASNSTTFSELCRVGMLCSRAQFLANQEGIPIAKRLVNGDASETGILKCMEMLVGNTAGFRESYAKIFEIPFNSTNKFQISVHVNPNSSALLLVMKGAPERIVDRCSTLRVKNTTITLQAEDREVLQSAILELGYLGERVLAFADLDLPAQFTQDFPFNAEEINFPITELRLLGFMSMIDPPRDGVLEAVKKCKSAGIRVIMVTGDHPVTALAIAKKVGIITGAASTAYDIAMHRNVSVSKLTETEKMMCTAAVITGNNLREMDSDELDDTVNEYREIVFARTSPQQKLQIVESFQRNFEVVAVTGDGVNDSPALKKADIGIAMGITGSDVSKEAADMILLDDNFASIVTGIEEGRLIFDNLKKSIAYMLTSNVPEMIPFVLHILLGIPLPLHIMAILIIDVGTDLWPGISLAYEKPEADIMSRMPRDIHKDRLVTMKLILFTNLNIGIIQTFAGLNCYLYVMAEHGFLPEKLLWIRKDWASQENDLQDSFGQKWTRHERILLERKGASAFFLAIVITQIADAVICKTRRLSICEQGMGNHVMNFGIIFEMAVALLVVYCPVINEVFALVPVNPRAVTPALPYAFLIIIFDETRRFLLRTTPNGWVDRETYF